MAYRIGKGATISKAGTPIEQVVSISPPQMEMAEIDYTNIASTAKEYRLGWVDGGEASFTVLWDSSHSGLVSDFQARTLRAYSIAVTGGGSISFSAYIKSFHVNEVSVDNVVTVTVTLRCTGLPSIS